MQINITGNQPSLRTKQANLKTHHRPGAPDYTVEFQYWDYSWNFFVLYGRLVVAI